MANNKEAEMKERKERRDTQMAILNSNMRNLYVMGSALNSTEYGAIAERVTKLGYPGTMASGDSVVGQYVTNLHAKAAFEALEAGKDPYKFGSVMPVQILEGAKEFYEEGFDRIFVEDALRLLEIKGVSQKNLSPEDRRLTMGELAEKDEELYTDLKKSYFEGVVQVGIGSSMIGAYQARVRGLEKMLQTDPDKKSE